MALQKTRLMLEIEDEFNRSIENLLIERYYGPRQMTYAEIALDLSMSTATVGAYMRALGVNQKSIAFKAMRTPEFYDNYLALDSRTVKELIKEKAS